MYEYALALCKEISYQSGGDSSFVANGLMVSYCFAWFFKFLNYKCYNLSQGY